MNTSQLLPRCYRLIASRRFFQFVLVLFVIETAWIAVSGRYPMAFDEDFHLGIIRLYARQWSPFFTQQPAGGDSFGALTHNTSYLYHYLMSFPYRLVDGLWHSSFIDVLVLRFFSLGFVAIGIVLFRRVLARAKVSPALTNVVSLCFVLTPLVPFVAAQMNYDNLLFPFCAGVLWLCLDFTGRLQRGRFDSGRFIALLSLCMFASLVKFTFLPVFFAVAAYIGFELWRSASRQSLTLRSWCKTMAHDFQSHTGVIRIGLIAVFIIAAGLFIATYGYNLVHYYTPTPECDQVLNAQRCTAYGAWFRNFNYAHSHGAIDMNPLLFSQHWAAAYIASFFNVLNGIYSGFVIGPSLPVLYYGGIGLLTLSIAVTIRYGRRLWADPALRLFIVSIVVYIAALWLQNYADWRHLGHHVGEQGRYFMVLLLPAYLLLAVAWQRALERRRTIRWLLFVLVLAVFSQGGSITPYIVHSNSDWWWRDNHLAAGLNNAVRPVISRLVVGANEPDILPWRDTSHHH